MNELEFTQEQTRPSSVFGWSDSTLGGSQYVILGVPFDATSTYLPGSRFGPDAIREASTTLKLFNPRFGLSARDIRTFDAGNLRVFQSNLPKTLDFVSLSLKEIMAAKKVPIMLGGEHSITLGAIRALPRNSTLIQFDAHQDLMDAYPPNTNQRYTHASTFRRIKEERRDIQLAQIGVRDYTHEEEHEFAESEDILVVPARELLEPTPEHIADRILEWSDNRSAYISIDMDVFDPAFAPDVANPEPLGVSPHAFFLLLERLLGGIGLLGLDVVEVISGARPNITALLAARAIYHTTVVVEVGHRLVAKNAG